MNRVSGHGDAIAQRDVPCVIIGLSSRLSPFSFMGPASEMVICLFAIAASWQAYYSFFPLLAKQQLLTIVILFYVATQILLVLYTLFWVASTTFCLENCLAFVKEWKMTAIVKCIKLNDRLVSSQKNVTKKTYLYTFILAIVSLETCDALQSLRGKWIWGLANLE